MIMDHDALARDSRQPEQRRHRTPSGGPAGYGRLDGLPGGIVAARTDITDMVWRVCLRDTNSVTHAGH